MTVGPSSITVHQPTTAATQKAIVAIILSFVRTASPTTAVLQKNEADLIKSIGKTSGNLSATIGPAT